MKLPLLISVPHAGLRVAPEIEDLNLLGPEDIIEDGDEGAGEIYSFKNDVAAFVTTDIARAYVDTNRSADDMSADGVIKKYTIYKKPIYRAAPTKAQIQKLLACYYYPYHHKLSNLSGQAKLGIDCHTMAGAAPPINREAGQERPLICLSNADSTCPSDWLELMARSLSNSFDCEISLNKPFSGGYIIRHHKQEIPWMQLEISRKEFTSISFKRVYILEAFSEFCSNLF